MKSVEVDEVMTQIYKVCVAVFMVDSFGTVNVESRSRFLNLEPVVGEQEGQEKFSDAREEVFQDHEKTLDVEKRKVGKKFDSHQEEDDEEREDGEKGPESREEEMTKIGDIGQERRYWPRKQSGRKR